MNDEHIPQDEEDTSTETEIPVEEQTLVCDPCMEAPQKGLQPWCADIK